MSLTIPHFQSRCLRDDGAGIRQDVHYWIKVDSIVNAKPG